ncbi:hypothetical protein D3C71_1212260 [compost metagenome]
MLLLEHVLVAVTQVHDRLHVHLVIGGQHGGGILCILEALGDRLAQTGHLHALFARRILGRGNRARSSRNGSRGRSGRALGDGGKNVALQNLAALARTVDIGRRDVVVGSNLGSSRCSRHRRCGSRGGRNCSSGRCGGSRSSSGRRGSSRSGSCSTSSTFRDLAEQRVETDGFTVLRNDFGQHAGSRGRNFDGNLVGFQFDQRLIGLDRIADLLEPGADGRLADGLAEGWNADFGCHDLFPFFSRFVSNKLGETAEKSAAESVFEEGFQLCQMLRHQAGRR